MADTLDDKIAASIPTETYYEDYYREMSVEAQLQGDTESANVLKYISDDEREHHDLLRSLQCNRHPELCPYGPGQDAEYKFRTWLMRGF